MKGDKSLERASEEYLKLLDFIIEQPSGAMIEYKSVEDTLSVRMDTAGKQKLRRAIKRAGRIASVFKNVGYQMGDTENCMGILGNRLLRIDSSIRSADRTHKVIQAKFYAELPENQQKAIVFTGAIFSVLMTEAEKAKRGLYLDSAERDKRLQLKTGNPVNVIDPA